MIDINNVSFAYPRGGDVLSDFSLSFAEGGVYGLLGKNGTGKSTLLYLMMGLLRPQRGTVTYNDIDTFTRDPEVLSDCFLVPEEYDLPPITLRRYVRVLAPFYPRFSQALLTSYLRSFDLPDDVHLGRLSMGQKKKVYMCLALAAGTRVLLLDEPTNGLDILSKSQFRAVMTAGSEPDKTIIISTHQVHDIERLVNHVVIIDRNCVLHDAPYDESAHGSLEQLFIDTMTPKY